MTSREASRNLVKEVCFGLKTRIVAKGVTPDLDRTEHPTRPILLRGAIAPNSDTRQVQLQTAVTHPDLPKKRRHSKQL